MRERGGSFSLFPGHAGQEPWVLLSAAGLGTWEPGQDRRPSSEAGWPFREQWLRCPPRHSDRHLQSLFSALPKASSVSRDTVLGYRDRAPCGIVLSGVCASHPVWDC